MTPERVAIIWANFDRYRRIAQELHDMRGMSGTLRTRTAMGRRKGRELTLELAVFAAEWLGDKGKPDVVCEMAAERHPTARRSGVRSRRPSS